MNGDFNAHASIQDFGKELAQKIEFVCSDMWKPYLQLIERHCSQALNILDRSLALQPQKRACLSAQGGLPAILGL